VRKRLSAKGFTLIEFSMVLVILGLLATISVGLIPNLTERAREARLKSDLSSAYKASLDYHLNNPESVVGIHDLEDYGFVGSSRAEFSVIDGTEERLTITATHPRVRGILFINRDGRISKL
jgi:prepilin-type N-terminal cleavage/methylation domain-containing protein